LSIGCPPASRVIIDSVPIAILRSPSGASPVELFPSLILLPVGYKPLEVLTSPCTIISLIIIGLSVAFPKAVTACKFRAVATALSSSSPIIIFPLAKAEPIGLTPSAASCSAVTSVPVVGKVISVTPVVRKVNEFAPMVVRFPPKVMVLPELSTPVPPLAPDKTPVTSVVKDTAPHDGFPTPPPCKTVVVVP